MTGDGGSRSVGKADLITMWVFPQDPTSTPNPVPVKVGADIKPGPIGSRVAVYDYNRDRDEVYDEAAPTATSEYQPSDFRFHQLNAYAIVARAVELVEMELGRMLRWGFDASRLIVLPHAGQLANAYYNEDTRSIQLYSFRSGDDVFHTSLSHDIVAHETGHAILDSVRDRYTEGLHRETGALHEALGDLTAVFAALSHAPVRRAVAAQLDTQNLVSDIAERFKGNHEALRDLVGGPQPASYWKGVMTPHALSLKFTRAVYAALCALQRHVDEKLKSPVASLKQVRTILQRMVVRALDYLPPADATFGDFALAILAADSAFRPHDQEGYRRVVREVFTEHGLLPHRVSTESSRPIGPSAWKEFPAAWPHATLEEAYHFLDHNREHLALSRHGDLRDFVVRAFHCTHRPTEPENDQVIIVYEYPVDSELVGDKFRAAEGQWITVWGGGTLVFDAERNLVHHARKPVTSQRVDDAKEFIADALVRRMVTIAGTSPGEQLLDSDRGRHWMLEFAADRVRLRSNPAARCGGERGHSGGVS